jgi:hypothetical protein
MIDMITDSNTDSLVWALTKNGSHQDELDAFVPSNLVVLHQVA